MFNVGGGEIIVIALIALIVLGPQRLPDAARQVGKVMGDLRRFSAGFQNEMKSAFVDEETATAISTARRDLLGPAGRGTSPVSRAINAVSAQGDRDAAPTDAPSEVAAPVAAAVTPAPTARKAAPPRAAARPATTKAAKATKAVKATKAPSAKAGATTKPAKTTSMPAKATKATKTAKTKTGVTKPAVTKPVAPKAAGSGKGTKAVPKASPPRTNGS